ncbi:DNA repair protein REV1 [Nilaparvata lugens]|uniref:DNA repair protein REV1 n=1 Tax=Nilaparvata lugens TaxID=108931 RepID=UPI00193D7185|nr:DNA repair protein REV1 [Nilaparvata lugens]
MLKSKRLKRKDPDETEDWGKYMDLKKRKLQEQFTSESENVKKSSVGSNLFQGVSIFVNGFTVPSADELRLLMMKYGGVYHHYHRPRITTHIIASNLPDVKIKQFNFDKIKLVKPEWITDSIKENRILDYKMYMLYSNQSKTQPKLKFEIMKHSSCKTLMSSKVEDEMKEKCLKSECAVVISPNDRPSFERINTSSNFDVDEGSNPIQEEIVAAEDLPGSSPEKANLEVDERTLARNDRIPDTNYRSHHSKSVENPVINKCNSYTKTASEENFLDEFYSNSRLHHISTMGATFKQYVNDLREKSDNTFPAIDELKQWSLQHKPTTSIDIADEDSHFDCMQSQKDTDESVIMHIDMDCFFVSVGIRNRPELRGHPVAVTHAKANAQVQPRKGVDRKTEIDIYKTRRNERYKSTSTENKNVDSNVSEVDARHSWVDVIGELDSMSEIASCSYEARSAGVKNGMFLGQAIKLCPNLKTIPYDFEDYKQVSYTLYNTVAEFTLDIEAVSCDEMFVDCSRLLKKSCSTPSDFATFLRQRIKDRTGCPCSTGFGVNRLQARLATKKAKPNGQYHIQSRDILTFIRDIRVADLPGVGRSLSYRLSEMGIQTCEELQNESLVKLQKLFGMKTGGTLYNFDHNFGHFHFLKRLSCEVEKRLHEVQMRARCITLKLMVKAKGAPEETAKFLGHGVCDNVAKSSTLNLPVSDASSILREVILIYKRLKVNPQDLRGVGIQLSRLESAKPTKTNTAIDKFLRRVDNSKPGTSSSKSTACSPTKQVTAQKIERGFAVKTRINEHENASSSSNFECPPNLDEEFLAALPEDIKLELLRDRNLLNEQMKLVNENQELDKSEEIHANRLNSEDEIHNLTISQIDESFLAALPTCLKEEITERALKNRQNKMAALVEEKGSQEDGYPEAESSITTEEPISLDEVRDMARAWVSQQPEPQEADIQTFASYLNKFILSHQLDSLNIAINTLCRSILSKNENLMWKKGYHLVIELVQETMRIEYGGPLYLDNELHRVDR